jgi:ankyrin repeat protein
MRYTTLRKGKENKMKHKPIIAILILIIIHCKSSMNSHYDYKENSRLKLCDSNNSNTLFENDTNINVKVDNGIPILGYYAKIGNIHCIDKLLSLGANIHSTDPNGFTPFIYSVYSNRRVMKLLLDKGANINDETPSGGNSLILAAEIGNIDTLKFLLENKVNVNHITKYKGTPLMHASIRGHIKIVKELLENGADPNIADNVNISPLANAASNGHVEIVELLLKYKANANIKDYKGYTAIMAPSDSQYPKETHLKILEMLVNSGANINEKNDNGDSALSIAKKRRLIKIIAKLEELGAKD